MSLARSASGPGGLSINTGAANNSAATPSTQASGGLFGASTTATPAAAPASAGGGLFGGNQQKTGTSLFGASTAGTTGSGLFGAAAGNSQQTQNTGGGQIGGGLFGNTSTAQQQPATTGGGLFGAAMSQQQKPATPGGMFGTSTAQQQPQQSSGLFNTSTTGQTTTGGTGMFTQPQQKPSTGIFPQAQPQQSQSQPATQVSAVQINYDNLRPRSRFDELAQPVQEEIALIDKGIQRVIKMKDEIGEFMPQHEQDIAQLGRDVRFVESKFRAVQVALDRDIQTVKALQDLAKKNVADAQLSFKATDNLKLPTHYHQAGLFASQPPAAEPGATDDAAATHANAQDLITYFNRVCDGVDKYKRRLDEYRGEIERDMPGVENGLYEQIRAFRDRNGVGAAAVQDQLGQVLSALRETGNAIVAQAGQIADTRERLSRLQAGIVDSGVYALGMTA